MLITDLNRMHWDTLTGFVDYGAKLRFHRKLMLQFFQPNALKNYHPVMIQMTHKMLGRLLETPEKFLHHIRKYI